MSLVNRTRFIPILMVLLMLFGCSGSQKPSQEHFPTLSMEEARETQNAQLQEFMDLVPADQVTGVRGPISEMSPMSCDVTLGGTRSYGQDDTGAYSLPGGAEVLLQGTMDVPAFFEEIARKQSALGREVQEQNNTSLRLVIDFPDGFNYSLAYYPGNENHGPSIGFDSFSPCFLPTEDVSLFKKY